jgi:nitrite reductase (NADH) large subunit
VTPGGEGRRRLVVIGNGMAGARLVDDVLVGGGADFEITVFGDEPHGNYNRILLSGVLAGTHDPRDVFINPIEWYEQNGVRLLAGVRAARIDRAARLVHSEDGRAVPYDALVIATGSSPFVPPVDGLVDGDGQPKPGVFVFRTLDDCDRIAAWARSARKAAVIGGGLLGLEAARGLLNLGPEVHVVHLMPHLMEVQLDGSAGAILARALREMGVHVHLEKATTAILGDGAVSGLAFKDGSTLDCDMVVLSAGIRPNVCLARDAGLTVRRGIVVGDDLASADDPAVFAVGECAEHRGRVYGLVAPLWEQTAVLAKRLTGRDPRATYRGSVVSTKLKVMGVDLAVMGEREPRDDDDEVVTYAEPKRGVYKKLIVREGRLVGAILLGDSAGAPALLQAFDRAADLPDVRADVLFPGSGAPRSLNVADLPDDAQICNCNGVSKGRIVEVARGGARNLGDVGRATRAGTGCGTCKVQVRAILDAVAEEVPAGAVLSTLPQPVGELR